MFAERKVRSPLRLAAAVVLLLAMFTACTSKAAKAQEKIELGQKYLTELNYTEAVASFTEAIELDPENIPAYMGRAEAYVGLEQYPEAKADYTTAIEKAAELPYTQAQAYVGRAEVNELTTANEDALSDYEAAQELLEAENIAEKEPVEEDVLTALKKKILAAIARLKALFETPEEPAEPLREYGEYPTNATIEQSLQRLNDALAKKGRQSVELIPNAECAKIMVESANNLEKLFTDQISEEEHDQKQQESWNRLYSAGEESIGGMGAESLEGLKRESNVIESSLIAPEVSFADSIHEETKYVAIGYSDSGNYIMVREFATLHGADS